MTARLVAATGTSSIGYGLADVALGLLAVSLTRDPRLVTGVFVAARLPWLVLGTPVASFVDRRRLPANVMLAADGCRAAMLLVTTGLILGGRASLPLLYATALVVGTGEVAHSAATNVVLPVIASGDQLSRANGYIGASLSAGYGIVGPAVGGLIYSAGRAVPFAADAVSFAASGVLLTPLRSVEVEQPPADEATTERRAAWRSIAEHRLLRVLLVQLAALALAQAMALSTLPLFGRVHLGLTTAAYGLFLGATAVGNVAGGVLAPRLWANRRSTVAIIVGSGLVMGVSYVAMAQSHSIAVAFVGLTLEGVAVGILNTVSPTLRMEHAPADARARVTTLFTQVVFAAQPVGAVLSGLLARRYGVTTSFATAGAIMLATMLLTDRPLRRAVTAVGA